MPSSANTIAAIRSARILIVADEFHVRKSIRTLLLAAGVTDVHDAADGAGGLLAAGTLDPDVVILDWQMPAMEGPEFVRRLRALDQPALPHVPIIMLTGHGGQSRVIEAMRLGVHEFLLKPVSGQALQERLASVLVHPRPVTQRGDDHASRSPRRSTAQSRM
jgi:two-component system, chemotaxis family, chemotaxis protein CheY